MENKELKVKNYFHHFQEMNEKSGIMHSVLAMGTLVTQRVNAPEPEAKKAIIEVIELIDRLEGMMSFFDPDSQLCQINQQAGKAWVTVDPELLMVIKESKRYARLTGGVFDITIAALVSLWQQYGKSGRIPASSLMEEIIKNVNYECILIDEENKKIKLSNIGQQIDLGGIAKGYAANQIIQFYRQRGVSSSMINIGGNVALLGKRVDAKPWQVGIQDPDQERGQCLATVAVSDTSVVTSGDYERFFLEGDRRYHHILNPFTGYPADSNLRSVTVIHRDAMLADILSTTLFILGLEKGIVMLQRFEDIEVIMVHEDKKIYLSKGLLKKFQLMARGYSLFQF